MTTHPVDRPSTRPAYAWSLLAGLAVFALYARTLAPSTAFWDASEYIATAHILGIPHPPGNPLFVVLARAWSVLLEPTGWSVAVRINLFSAFMSASAHALWFLVFHHVLTGARRGPGFARVGAGVAVLVSATAFTVWNQSNVNEKVYTVSLLTVALLSWLALRWRARLEEPGRRPGNVLVLMAFVLALSVGNHLMAFLAAPALVVFVALTRWRTMLEWRLYPAVAAAVVLGLSVHLFLPLRANLNPVINEAAPECPTLSSSVAAIATWGKAGCEPLGASLTRAQYTLEGEPGPGLTGPRQAPLRVQALTYLQYFDWQWGRSIEGDDRVLPPLRVLFTLLFVALGLQGARFHLARDRGTFAYVAVLFATLSAGLVWYLNFEWGFSIPAAAGLVPREVREREYFFIASFSLWGLWAGLGVVAMWKTLAERVGSLGRAAPVLAVAVLPLVLNASWADRADDRVARDFAYNLLMSVEPYGVLFTGGDNDTFPLWYLQEVEGVRRDVTVVVTAYLGSEWYARQLRDLTTPCEAGRDWTDDPTRILCQRDYTTSEVAAVYTHDPDTASAGQVALAIDAPVRPPSRPILDLDDDTLRQVAGTYVQLETGRRFSFGEVETVLPQDTVLYPMHQFMLAILTATAGDRPVYFSSTSNVGDWLGVERQLVREGLAYRLQGPLRPEAPPTGLVPLPADSPLTAVTGHWIDVPRTRRLVEEVFLKRDGLPEWDHWPDMAAAGFPLYWAWTHYALAQAAWVTGDAAESQRQVEQAEAWAALGS